MPDSQEKNLSAEDRPRTKLPEAEPRGYFEGESLTRRKVFVVASQALGGIAGAAVVLPAIGFALAPVFERGKERWEAVGTTADFVPDTYKQVVFTETLGIGEVGKTTAYVRQGSEKYGEDPAEYIAISSRCAHLGCPVRFVQAAANFICPCHGGVYDFIGKRIGGPPVRPLDRFYTRVAAGTVFIGPRFSVNSELERFSPRDPGEPLDGVGQYLYPSRPTMRKLPNT